MNKYLAKGFFIIEHKSKQLSSLPNDMKPIIHAIDQLRTDLVMEKITSIYSVANTIKKLHVQSDFYFI